MTTGQWYTLVRFHETPEQLTAVSQARTAQEAWLLLEQWAEAFPNDTTVVFDAEQHPLQQDELEALATGRRPPRTPADHGR